MHSKIIERGSRENMQPRPGCINVCLFRLSYLLIEEVKFLPKLLVWKLICQTRTDSVVAASWNFFTTSFEFWNFQVTKISSKKQAFCWRKFIKLFRKLKQALNFSPTVKLICREADCKISEESIQFFSRKSSVEYNLGYFSADFLKFWGQSSYFKRLYLSNHEVFWESEDIDEMATSQIFQQKSVRTYVLTSE